MPTYSLPQKFIENVKKQLPETEWEAFFAVYNNPPFKGIRLNPLKGEINRLKACLPFLQEQIEWEENGFYTTMEKTGASPFHFAGIFYSQEPSAMSVAPLLDVQAGERVLDLCSAPGGKGTQLACKMEGKGIIVLNEPILSRAKILSQNVERMGITNAVVCSELPEKLSQKFAGYFDKVLVDAPCSGEGMFRKNADEALKEWSEENVALCVQRQAHILKEATKMLRVGGKLAYSTCTFAEAEDEGQVRDYLKNHPQMRLFTQKKLYPHKTKGEGHFVALFEKTGKQENCLLRPLKSTISRAQEDVYRAFEKSTFVKKIADTLHETGGVLYALPNDVFDWKGLQVLRVGIRLGEVKNGRFEPNHSLAMATKKETFQRVVNLSREDARVGKYLRGETIEAQVENGWCAVCVEGYPLGWGKAVNGTIKNHLPKGIRKVQ